MPARATLTALMASSIAACGPGAVGPDVAQAPPPRAVAAPAAPSAPSATSASREQPPSEPAQVRSACNEQTAQTFLMRHSYLWNADATENERQRRKAVHRRAIRYRTRHYGYVEGFGDPKWNHLEPVHYAQYGSFFGIGIQMNNRVLVALRCVERAIVNACDDSYTPDVLDGLRLRNTFYNGEVSNHTYGIAIDIDPNRNSCCGCLPPLSDWPVCQQPASSAYERTEIPRCWIEHFERFGFYWLGHDTLEDTMHFEFLGDPENISKG